MHLVAHREPARNQRLERHAAGFTDRASERRPEDLAGPAQAVEHLSIFAAEPHHLAEALVDRAIGAVTECLVLDHHQRLACRRQAGHRTDRTEVVIGMERDGAGGGVLGRLIEVLRPAFAYGNSHDGATHRAAHPVPTNRRPGMKDHAVGQIRNGFRCRNDIDQNRIAGANAPHRFMVGLVDGLQRLAFPATYRPWSFSSRPARWEFPPAGGLQRTCATAAPWLARFTANVSSPMLITRGAAPSKSRETSWSFSIIAVPVSARRLNMHRSQIQRQHALPDEAPVVTAPRP